jgi:hypothetical protein
VLSLAWIVGGRMLAQRWEREADRAWAALGSPMTSFAARFPKRPSNEAARRLDPIASGLGIVVAPVGAASPKKPMAANSKAFEAIRKEMGDWFEAQLANASDRVEEPPERVSSFLSEQATGLQYLVAQLRAGETPAWEQDLDRLAEAPMPNLAGQRALARLLCASALEAQRTGRSAEGLEAMEAAAKVAASLRDRPELASRAVEIGLLVDHAAALRKIDGVPPAWYAAISERDPRKSLMLSMQTEAWLVDRMLERGGTKGWTRSMEGGAAEGPSSLQDRVLAFYEKPYALLAAADYSRAMAGTAAAVQAQDACSFERETWEGVEEKATSSIGF